MFHSVTFGNKNSWEDWNLAPSYRPFFSPPKVKKNVIDIPGSNGSLDLSTAITGYPLYENRTGTLEFYILNSWNSEVEKEIPWYILYSDIMNYLHGKEMTAILEDEPDYMYYGSFTVEAFTPGENNSKITIGYDLYPFKFKKSQLSDDWVWDPFNFRTGMTTNTLTKDVAITSEPKVISLSTDVIGFEPNKPVISVKTDNRQGVHVKFTNKVTNKVVEKDFLDGDNQDDDIFFSGQNVEFEIKTQSGSGSLTIYFTEGKL